MKLERLHGFPKVWSLGHPAIAELFDGEVVVQEKVDGSQFTAGVTADGVLRCRSRGAEIDTDAPVDLFAPAVATFRRLHEEGKLVEGWQYRGEAVCRPKHNTLAYGRAPSGGVILFDVDVGLEDRVDPDVLDQIADVLGLEVVPLLYQGVIHSAEQLKALLDTESCLGGCKVEGVVAKNYSRWGEDGKMLMGKLVSEAFKETHHHDWKARNPKRADLMESIIDAYATARRWEKAVERLRDDGKLENSPRDIGLLIREVPDDVLEECGGEIKDLIFRHFWPEIKKGITRGLPDWYKNTLAEQQFAR